MKYAAVTALIYKILDVLIPRFMTEDVALIDTGERYEIVCSMVDVMEWERFDGVATMRVFNFLGFALFPKMIGEVRPWS
jgi:hypothetical protein